MSTLYELTNDFLMLLETARIPADYLIPQEPKVDTVKLKTDIKAGKDLSGIAHLESGYSLRIK